MKPFVTALTIAAGFSLSTASADNHEEIIYRAKGKNIYRAAESAAQRTGRSTYRAAVRAQYDGHVYRDEGLATAREEHKTWVLSLHCDLSNWSTIHAGHALAD